MEFILVFAPMVFLIYLALYYSEALVETIRKGREGRSWQTYRTDSDRKRSVSL